MRDPSVLEGCTSWPSSFVERYRSAGVWRDETIGEMLDGAVARYGPKVALVADGRRYTYRELGELTERLANQLARLGVRAGDRIVVQLPNLPEFVLLYFALAKIGALPIMALPAHRATEIEYFVRHADASGYAIPRTYRNFDYVALAREMKEKNPGVRWIFVADRDVPA